MESGEKGRDRKTAAIVALAIVLCVLSCAAAWGEECARQAVTQSWLGLSGLYVMPTARVLGPGKLALGYNEAKHVEVFSYTRYMDRQIHAPITAGIGNRFELSVMYQSNQYDVSLLPVLENDSLVTAGMKLQVFSETRHRPAVALAVRDVFDQDTDADPLKNVHNGRKYFLLASKRIVQDKPTGRFVDAHVGMGSDENKSVSAMFGFEVALTNQISVLTEGMWDSPFVNFRDSHSNSPVGRSDVPGRFIYDMGARLYPDLLPGMTIDAGFIGDGSFEFSFGVGYVVGL